MGMVRDQERTNYTPEGKRERAERVNCYRSITQPSLR